VSDEAVKRYRGQRGPNKVPRPKMALISMRLPQEVLDFYEGSSVRMRAVLVAWADGKLVSRDDT